MADIKSPPQLSPVNIEPNRQAGIDSPAKGSRVGREANKTTGDPGTRGEEADASVETTENKKLGKS